MRPKPFIPDILNGDARYIRDRTSGMAWHKCCHRTLYADTDRSQAVYHANYLKYFEMGRASLMRDAAYTYREIEESGYVYPIIKVELEYFSPLYYDDPMCIYTRPTEMELVKLRFDYVITREDTGDLVCRGFTRHCATNVSGTPVAIDEKTVHLWKIFPQ